MQVVLDNLNAIIVGGAVMLIMAAMTMSNQTAQVDSTRYYSGRSQFSQLTEFVERDFRNLGMNADTSLGMIIGYQWDQDAKFIEFQTMSDTTDGAAPSQIKYELTTSHWEKTDSDSIQCYELIRYAYSGGSYKDVGASMNTLTSFEIQLFDENESSVTGDLNDTRIIEVAMIAISPLGEGGTIKRLRWRKRYMPINLKFN